MYPNNSSSGEDDRFSPVVSTSTSSSASRPRPRSAKPATRQFDLGHQHHHHHHHHPHVRDLNPHTLAEKWSRAEEKLEKRKHRRREVPEGGERRDEPRVEAVDRDDGYETDSGRFGELGWRCCSPERREGKLTRPSSLDRTGVTGQRPTSLAYRFGV